jgi:UDP-N-acetylmuramate dehydrogenase
VTIEPDVALADWCTLGVGGPARWFCHARDECTVADAFEWAADRRVPVHVLGGGSNVVCADRGYHGLVVHVDIPGVAVEREGDHTLVTAGAGEPWDPLVARVVALELAGFECLSGIPGRVGGTPSQNVGAYGQDVSASIVRVRTFDRDAADFVELSRDACAFGYRTSRFKGEDRERFVVTRVEFSLAPGPATLTYADVRDQFRRAGTTTPSLDEVRQAVLSIRRRKGMVIEPQNPANQSVGSFFVNPTISSRQFDELVARYPALPHYPLGADTVKIPAAWLIEQSGFTRGTQDGAVGVSPLQAQAIVNLGGATADDVVRLAGAIKRAVWNRFRIAIVPEPVFVGFDQTPDLAWLLGSGPDGE